MASPSVAPSTTSASLDKYWRKIQGPLAEFAFAHGKRREKKFFDSLQATPMEWSARENTFAVDTKERGGIASLRDSGPMAKASSVNAPECTVSAIHLNGRFSIGDVGRWADAGQRNQIKRQIQVQSSQKMDAMVEAFSDYWYGYPTALQATSDSDIAGTSATMTFATAYGNANITNPKYIASMFKVGERYMLTDSSNALIDGTDSWGEVTAVDKTNGTATFTFDGSITYSTNGIRFYKANQVEAATTADSDLNRGLTGMLEIWTSTSVQQLSGGSEANWNVAYSSTASGRFTPAKLRRGRDEVENESGYQIDFAFIAQGVYRDMVVQERAGLRYDVATDMTLDGDVKAKGMQFYTLKGVPPGWVLGGAKACLRKWEILPVEGDSAYAELQAYQDYAAKFGRTDWFGNVICASRKGLFYYNNQQES